MSAEHDDGLGNGRATIVDVARIAGVSTSTVSHVVNGTRTVSDQTAARVLAAIAETGYTQHAAARSLRRAQTDSIGLVVSDSGQPAFRDMVSGVEAAASEDGFVLLLADSAEDPQRELRAIEALQSRRVDGLILARAAGSSPAALDWVRAQGVPVVLIDRLTDPSLDQVGVESETAMRTLVAHLLDLGHRRIAMTTGNLAVPTLRERYNGYLTAHAIRGLPVDPALALEGVGSAAETRTLVTELLSGPERPTALVAGSSPMAVGGLQAAADLGLRIPEDLAFVAFDSLPNPELMRTPITTADQPAYEVGREAMRLLVRRLHEPDNPPTTMRLAAHISHRESCGCGAPGAPLTF